MGAHLPNISWVCPCVVIGGRQRPANKRRMGKQLAEEALIQAHTCHLLILAIGDLAGTFSLPHTKMKKVD